MESIQIACYVGLGAILGFIAWKVNKLIVDNVKAGCMLKKLFPDKEVENETKN